MNICVILHNLYHCNKARLHVVQTTDHDATCWCTSAFYFAIHVQVHRTLSVVHVTELGHHRVPCDDVCYAMMCAMRTRRSNVQVDLAFGQQPSHTHMCDILKLSDISICICANAVQYPVLPFGHLVQLPATGCILRLCHLSSQLNATTLENLWGSSLNCWHGDNDVANT